MRILLITTSYPTVSDGSEAAGAFIADFAQELNRQGHVTAVVAPGPDDTLGTRTSAGRLVDDDGDASAADDDSADSDTPKVVVFRYHAPAVPLSTLKLLRPDHCLQIVSVLLRGQSATRQAVRTFRPDHLLACWVLPSGFWAMRTSQQLGVPYSTWALGSDIWQLSRIPLVRRVLQTVLHKADSVFADGRQLGRHTGLLAGRSCQFLPSSRLLKPGRSGDSVRGAGVRLAFLGRWHPNKGVDLLLDALSMLGDSAWERIQSVRLAGGGPLAAAVTVHVKRLQAQGRPVDLAGYQNRAQAAAFLQDADWVIIPSRIESIPVIFSDAMQLRRPVICTPVGDLPALIDQYQTGIVTSDVSAASLAKALSKVAVNDTRVDSAALAHCARAFSVSSTVDNFMKQIA